MKAVTCLLILGVFGRIQTNNQADKAKSVTLALETILEFDKNDNSVDVHFIDQIQSFLSNVKTLIDKNPKDYRRSNGNVFTFTDFLARALLIIRKYDDEDLKSVVRIIDDEARKFHYRGCKFHELLENYDVRRFVANKLDSLKDISIKDIRKDIKKAAIILKDGRFSDEERRFLKYINTLYRYDDVSKFEVFLKNIENYSNKYKRSELNLGKILRNGIRSIVFDHYSELKPNVRKDFKIRLETYWNKYKNPSRSYKNEWALSIGTPSIIRNAKFTLPKIYTPKNNEIKNKNQILNAFNHYYNNYNTGLIKTIKKIVENIKLAKSSQESNPTYTKEKILKKKHNNYPQTSFETYDIDKKSDFVSNMEVSKESKKNKNKKKHKRQRNHKNKEKKKHKHKSAETLESSEKSTSKSKHHHKIQKYTLPRSDMSSRTLNREKKIDKITKRDSKSKVTISIARMQPLWREIVNKLKKKSRMHHNKTKVKTFRPVQEDIKRISVSTSVESLEGNESFKRERAMAEVDSTGYKYSEHARSHATDSRKWFQQKHSISNEGISIESYELVKNALSRKLNDNDTLSLNNKTKSNTTHLESKLNNTIDVTDKHKQAYINNVTYDDLEFWTGTIKLKDLTTVNYTTTTVKVKPIVKFNTTNYIRNLNNTLKEVNKTILNNTIAFAKLSNISNDLDVDVKLKMMEGVGNDTLAAMNQLDIDSYLKQSQVLNGEHKQRVRLQMRNDINKIFGKTVEVTTPHDVMKFTDPLQALEDMDVL